MVQAVCRTLEKPHTSSQSVTLAYLSEPEDVVFMVRGCLDQSGGAFRAVPAKFRRLYGDGD